jgi:hypothetical protein
MAEPDKKIELELAVRDSVSATLKIIAANLESVNSKMSRGGNAIQESVETLQKVSVHTAGIGENAKQGTKSLLGVADVLKTITSVVSTGPIAFATATVAAIAAVGSQMGKLATRRLELKRLATDTGFTEAKISILQRYGKRMGFDPDVTHKNIIQAAGAIKEMYTGGAGSTLFTNLANIGEAKFGAELLKQVQAGGSIDAAFDKMADYYDQLFKKDPIQAAKFAQAMNVSESFLRDIKKNSEGLVPAYEMSADAAEAWAKRMSLVHESYNALWAGTMGFFIRTMILGDKAVAKVRHLFRDRIDRPDVTDPAQRQRMGLKPLSAEQLEELKRSKKDSTTVTGEIAASIKRLYEKGKEIPGRQEGGTVLPGRPYVVGEQGPETFTASGQSSEVGTAGPEVIRPGVGGQITKGITEGIAAADARARDYQPPSPVNVMAGRVVSRMAGPVSPLLKIMRAFGDDPAVRTALRKWTGLGSHYNVADNPSEPAPWKAGGEFEKLASLENQRCNLDAAQQNASGTQLKLIGGVNFTNVPPGVTTKAESDGLDKFSMARTQPLLS